MLKKQKQEFLIYWNMPSHHKSWNIKYWLLRKVPFVAGFMRLFWVAEIWWDIISHKYEDNNGTNYFYLLMNNYKEYK